MPDFTIQSVHSFWSQYHDPSVYKVISFMESVETWCDDSNAALEGLLARLGTILDQVGAIDLQQENRIIKACMAVKIGRAFRILYGFDYVYPSAAAKILAAAQSLKENGCLASEALLKRTLQFERIRLLRRVFAEERIELVSTIMEEAK